ncbi:Na+/H+ antiporter NhaC family protein [Lysinibacillus irui]|uniref:Na+/H+ antiporter NhaC family protein n=1 Tax=Lysinibacillus irui TaxID=2998077 RepID=A0AAJ5URD4_9BACI|nr:MULTISPECIES: Na+/H+ antiporter NhaC family protein [Lysinibacillus]MEA0555710.1 Na+/H+ antiporter NhaC family protein [Lysinibacillus irui]MEA0564241.1 Na+/H+ antiporter NhaC family protein [Lysinibacillus irui]MEA0977286.1 Na+/H+ antiporter NhaC family protein [Lysinibacillus irui]MEA1043440.1 Na+/H+ antiporter NhaC family protein [Lysinibacillus irui]WDV06791.1 TRAP transporter large permease subunit [Lysinibacillus irui]
MNAVIMAVAVMLILSLLRINVVLSLVLGAFVGGLTSGMGIEATVQSFTEGLGAGATIALSYGLLGGFAIAIAKTGIPELMIAGMLNILNGESNRKGLVKVLIFFLIFVMSILSQNVIPIHIAFIPLMIPPILKILNMLEVDRRIIATLIAVGLIGTYSFVPAGFGAIFQDIVATQVSEAGMTVSSRDVPAAMAIPVLGMLVGLIMAFIIYRKPRQYRQDDVETESLNVNVTKYVMFSTGLALVVALCAQVLTDSMIVGSFAGIMIMYFTGALKWKEADDILSEGMKMMAFIGFVMIAANGFAAVINATGDVDSLITSSITILQGNRSLAIFIMLVVGLVVTMGIGSSFATVPIIATLFVPLAQGLGLSPLAILCLIGTAGALGDAGSPASDSTLGPTAGLNVDGQHHHIWDTCVPTFIFINIPLIVFGWIACVFFL